MPSPLSCRHHVCALAVLLRRLCPRLSVAITPGFFRKEEIEKGIMSSSQQRHVVIPFLISLLKNEGKEEPCHAASVSSRLVRRGRSAAAPSVHIQYCSRAYSTSSHTLTKCPCAARRPLILLFILLILLDLVILLILFILLVPLDLFLLLFVLLVVVIHRISTSSSGGGP